MGRFSASFRKGTVWPVPPSALVLGPGPEHAPAAPRRKPAPGLVKHLGRPAGRFARPQILHQPDPGAAGLPRLALARRRVGPRVPSTRATYSKGSVIVGGQGSVHGCAGVVVMPDRGGQGQDALQDADHHPGGGVAAVPFQVELAFEGLIDRFDGLAQGLEQLSAGP